LDALSNRFSSDISSESFNEEPMLSKKLNPYIEAISLDKSCFLIQTGLKEGMKIIGDAVTDLKSSD
jgi:hypothetical protein